MTTPHEEDKRISAIERAARLKKGGASTFASTIIITWAYGKFFKEEMDPVLAVAVATMLGSMGTGFVLCFKDFRALLFRARNRRRT